MGDWTDDTDQMVVIMESIIYNEGQVTAVKIAKPCYIYTYKKQPQSV